MVIDPVGGESHVCRMKIRACALFGFLLAALSAQPPPAPPAPPAESSQFDFWLGDWEVTAKNGNVVGHSRVEKIASGWGVLESWESARFPGKSINAWNPAQRCWQQFWVGSGGAILELRGGLDAQGRMVITGQSPAPQGGTRLNRITYTPNADGTVRQHWEISADGGVTWSTSFDGLYHRVKPRA